MNEIKEKNGEEKGVKTGSKKNRGQFQPGNPGGPGRGKRKEEEIPLGDLIDEVERCISSGMVHKDAAVKLKAAGLALKLQGLKKSSDDSGPVIEPDTARIMDFLSRLSDGHLQATGQPIFPLDVLPIAEKHLFDCPDSPFADSGFEVVDDNL